jgi:small subunit ribosomal protein S6
MVQGHKQELLRYGSTVLKKYEGMFVVDTKETKKGPGVVEDQINALITKCKGEVVRVEDWDERKLAYEIGGTTNGSYYLYYFTGEPETIGTLNREVKLSPLVLRALFLSIKEIPEPQVREEEPAEERREAPAGVEAKEDTPEEDTPEVKAEEPAEDAGETPEKTEE